MNRVAQLSINVIVFAAGAIATLIAQSPAIKQMPTTQMSSSPMSVTDMSTHLKGTISHMQAVAPSMQRDIQLQLLMDRMKALGADLNLLLNRIQVLMSDKTLSQDKLRMQRAQNISRYVQTMIQSVDGVVFEMEQMQQNK